MSISENSHWGTKVLSESEDLQITLRKIDEFRPVREEIDKVMKKEDERKKFIEDALEYYSKENWGTTPVSVARGFLTFLRYNKEQRTKRSMVREALQNLLKLLFDTTQQYPPMKYSELKSTLNGITHDEDYFTDKEILLFYDTISYKLKFGPIRDKCHSLGDDVIRYLLIVEREVKANRAEFYNKWQAEEEEIRRIKAKRER